MKVALTWKSRDHDVARLWQFGENGIDVVDSWPRVTMLRDGGTLLKVVNIIKIISRQCFKGVF